jgi:signal transduction histidine kinase
MKSLILVSEPVAAHRGKTVPISTPAAADLRSENFLGSLAMSFLHDLRNPLAAIHSAAEMLNRSKHSEPQVQRLASNMYHASVRMQELLQDYIDLCRTRESQPRPSNLGTLVAHAVDMVAAVAEAQSVVVVQDVPADVVVAIDRRRIGSVLTNLLANALEAMPAGGSIHISAIAAESSVVIRVLDTGPGIAPEIRDRLFQPFVTARKPNGWGLGLARARQVVIEHGGEMWLESPPGEGTCFGFSLPVPPRNRQLKVEHFGRSRTLRPTDINVQTRNNTEDWRTR